MIYYFIPAFWLCGLLYYASSPRQVLHTKPLNLRQFTHLLALLISGFFCIYTVQIGMTIGVALTLALLLSTIALAAPVVIAKHLPTLAWPSLFVIFTLAISMHWYWGGDYVA